MGDLNQYTRPVNKQINTLSIKKKPKITIKLLVTSVRVKRWSEGAAALTQENAAIFCLQTVGPPVFSFGSRNSKSRVFLTTDAAVAFNTSNELASYWLPQSQIHVYQLWHRWKSETIFYRHYIRCLCYDHGESKYASLPLAIIFLYTKRGNIYGHTTSGWSTG